MWCGETSPDPILKNQNQAYLWISSVKCYTVYSHCCPNLGLLTKYIKTIQNILKGAAYLLLPHIMLFWKRKEVCN